MRGARAGRRSTSGSAAAAWPTAYAALAAAVAGCCAGAPAPPRLRSRRRAARRPALEAGRSRWPGARGCWRPRSRCRRGRWWRCARGGSVRRPPRAARRGPRRRPGRRDPAAAARGAALLVDGGPPGDGLEAKLGAAGVGGSAPRWSPTTSPTTRLGSRSSSAASRSPGSLYGRARRRVAAPRARGRASRRRSRGDELRSGRSASRCSGRRPSCSPEPLARRRPEHTALVLLARWHGFSMLLTADAEAEAVPIDPGPVDVLKVAHHGSADAGLARPARPHPAAPGGDLGRRRQLLRPPDRGDPGDPRRSRRAHPQDRPRRHGRARRSVPSSIAVDAGG